MWWSPSDALLGKLCGWSIPGRSWALLGDSAVTCLFLWHQKLSLFKAYFPSSKLLNQMNVRRNMRDRWKCWCAVACKSIHTHCPVVRRQRRCLISTMLAGLIIVSIKSNISFSGVGTLWTSRCLRWKLHNPFTLAILDRDAGNWSPKYLAGQIFPTPDGKHL